MNDLIDRLRFLASGQDDQHSLAITEAADALEQQMLDISIVSANLADARRQVAGLKALIADDAHAITFQTFAQYRSALIALIGCKP